MTFVILVVKLTNKEFSRMMSIFAENLDKMSKGIIVEPVSYKYDNEIGKITTSLNTLIKGISNTTEFSKEIGKGNLNADFKLLSQDDMLGKSLLEMRKSLVNAQNEEKQRKSEDELQNWTTKGIAKFGDILRKDNDDIEKLSYNIISSLVNYLEVEQGALFFMHEENDQKLLELIAAYAYKRKKYVDKKLKPNEGFVGRCVLEKKSIHMTEIPQDYIAINSGLGDTNPNSLLLVPLLMNNEVLGVIELASLNIFSEHKIKFVERIAENIAATISSVKINIQTARLLEESNRQSRLLAEKEQEMRQNMEELQTTQEEAARNEEIATGFVNAVNHTIIRADYNLDGTVAYANTKFLDIMEYAADEVVGKHYDMFVQPQDREDFKHAWRRIANGGKHYEQEVEYKTKTGKIWLLATYTAVRNNEGKVIKILYLAIDISAEKNKNLAYENEINAIENSVLKADYAPDGSMLHENKILLDTLGYNNATGTHKNSIFDMLGKEKLTKLKNAWNQVLNGIATELEESFHHARGKELWFKGIYSPVSDKDGKIYKIVYIGNDISQQKQLEEEAKQKNRELINQQQKYKENIENLEQIKNEKQERELEVQGLIHAIDSTAFAVEYDIDGKILKANKNYAKLYGYLPNEILGLNDKEIIKFDNDHEIFQYKQLWEQLQFGVIKQKLTKVEQENKTIWLYETFTPILENNKVVRVFKIAFDITKTKQIELEAQQKAVELTEKEQKLKQTVIEIRQAKNEIEQIKQKEMETAQNMLKNIDDHKNTLTEILNKIPGRIVLKDNEGRIIQANREAAKVFNMKLKSFIGLTDFDLYDELTATNIRNQEREIMRLGAKKYTITETLNDDEYIFAIIKMPFYIEYLQKTGLLYIQNDITETVKAEQKAKQRADALTKQEQTLKQNIQKLEQTKQQLQQQYQAQQKIQEKLNWEQDMFLALMDSLPSRITFKNKKSEFIRVNKTKARKLQIDNPNEVIGKTDYDYFPRKHAKKAELEERKLMKSGKPLLDLEERLVWNDGSITWGRTSRIPFKNKNNETIGTLIISNDITSEKINKTQKEFLEAAFEKIMEKIPIFIYRLNQRSEIIEIKGSAIRFLGFDEDYILNKNIHQIFPEINKHLINNEHTFEFNIKTKTSTYCFITHIFEDKLHENGLVGIAYHFTKQNNQLFDAEIERVKKQIKTNKKY